MLNTSISKTYLFPSNQIVSVFNNIPTKTIIKMAKDIQKRLLNDQTLAKKIKGEDEWGWVTKTDTKIQKMLLSYFASSELAGTYRITAEEEFIQSKNIDSTWQLIIDPLDGTSSFRKQKDTWGVMVGACDLSGILKYSWNLVSIGEVFSTQTGDNSPVKQKSLFEKASKGEKAAVDVYDYGSGAVEKFGVLFEKEFNISKNQYELTSYPAAIWAGWQLYQSNLDALLWLPSNQGKKWYPDYDLIFLDALQKQGYEILLGKIEKYNALVVIAPTKEDVEKLYQIGTSLIPKQIKTKLIKKTDLSITDNYIL